MPKPDLKVAGQWRYYEDPDGDGVRCACHGYRYGTPNELVKAHKKGMRQQTESS